MLPVDAMQWIHSTVDAQTRGQPLSAGIGTIDEEAAPAHNTHPPANQQGAERALLRLIPATNILPRPLNMLNRHLLYIDLDRKCSQWSAKIYT